MELFEIKNINCIVFGSLYFLEFVVIFFYLMLISCIGLKVAFMKPPKEFEGNEGDFLFKFKEKKEENETKVNSGTEMETKNLKLYF